MPHKNEAEHPTPLQPRGGLIAVVGRAFATCISAFRPYVCSSWIKDIEDRAAPTIVLLYVAIELQPSPAQADVGLEHKVGMCIVK